MNPGLTLRQSKYKANRLQGMSQYNAARAAGYSESYCKVACRLEKSAKISISELAEQMGITDKFLIKYIEKALKAKSRFRTKDGEKELYFGPDWQARHRFLETLLKLTERLKQPGVNVNVDNSKHEHITYVLADRMKEARERLNKRFENVESSAPANG